MKMDDFRADIDRIDRQLLALFEERMRLAREIGAYKAERGLPVFDAEREERLLGVRRAMVSDGSLSDAAAGFFQALMDLSKEQQRLVAAPMGEGGNLYLTGLCGSGKTTLARMTADLTGRPCADIDDMIERRAGKDIDAIFAECGEQGFRDLEAEAVREASLLRDTVIATGGGSILRQENIERMRASGRIVFLNRPPEAILADLDMQKRPLIRDEAAFWRLAYERRQLYLERCDIVLDNGGTAREAAERLARLLMGASV